MSESSILKKARDLVTYGKGDKKYPNILEVSYSFLPVEISPDFLAPLPDPTSILVNQIDFRNTTLPENKGKFAVVLDHIINEEECKQLLHMAELSAGGHCGGESVPNNGWRRAMVNAGPNREFLALDYRNSDRIVWDNPEIIHRLWLRILQAEGMKEYLTVLEGNKYKSVIGPRAVKNEESWKITKQGPNERMRFLKYGAGQYFREHCDGMYTTPDGSQRSYYTMHLYLNDSAQALGIPPPSASEKKKDSADALLQGGATTFHSRDMKHRLDVDPKVGRVLIFQQKDLLHSGDDVWAGIKYTMRSDLMYELNDSDTGGDDVVFEDA